MRLKRLFLRGLIGALLAAVVLLLFHKRSTERNDSEPTERGGEHAAGDWVRPEGDLVPRKLPAWFGQKGVPARRIAGRVLLGEAPVEGAVVELRHRLTAAKFVAPLRVQTRSDGTFDFGRQAPANYMVSANRAGLTGTQLRIDLSDPTMDPAPDALELVLTECEAILSGTIEDVSGGVIAGAGVLANETTEVTSNAEGHYEVCVRRGDLSIRVSADGYARANTRGSIYGSLTRDFELVPEAIVTGRTVRADDGRPVPFAEVSVRHSTERSRATVISDADGAFRLAELLPGRYQYTARSEGLAMRESETFVARVGQQNDEVICRLSPASEVRGLVLLEDGEPVAGASVFATTGRGWNWRQSVSQADGSFVLTALPPGELRLRVRGYDMLDEKPLRVEKPVEEITLRVAGRGAIEGRVTRNGEPVRGAEVYARGKGRGTSYGRDFSKPDGSYRMTGLKPGEYGVGAQVDDAFAESKDVTIERGETVRGVDIEMDLAATISGTVVDQNGEPVHGAYLTFQLGDGKDWGRATTDENGAYEARAMSGGGEYAVEIRPNVGSPIELRPAKGDSFPKTHLQDGFSHATGVRFVVQFDRLSISGRVLDGGGEPVSDVKVAATPAGASGGSGYYSRYYRRGMSTRTDVDGAFVIKELSAGDYNLEAATGAGLSVREPGVAAGTGGVELRLPQTGAIAATLRDFSNVRRVQACRTDAPSSDYGYRDRCTRARVTGENAVVEDLAVGRYRVVACGLGESAAEDVEVVAGKTASVTLTSTGTGTVDGRISDFIDGSPVVGATCRWVATTGMGSRSGCNSGEQSAAVTDADGRYRLQVPAAAEVWVHCTSHGQRHSLAIAPEKVQLNSGETHVLDQVSYRRRQRDPDDERGDAGIQWKWPDAPAEIESVTPGGAGEAAGLRAGDKALSVDGVPVEKVGPSIVHFMIHDRVIGATCAITVRRGSETIDTTLTLAQSTP